MLFQQECVTHLFGRRLKSSQIGATFITIFLKCANIRRVLGKYYFINLCVSPIYEAGQKDSQVHSYNENLQSTFLKMLKCNFAMFSIWQASTWQTGVSCKRPVSYQNVSSHFSHNLVLHHPSPADRGGAGRGQRVLHRDVPGGLAAVHL